MSHMYYYLTCPSLFRSRETVYQINKHSHYPSLKSIRKQNPSQYFSQFLNEYCSRQINFKRNDQKIFASIYKKKTNLSATILDGYWLLKRQRKQIESVQIFGCKGIVFESIALFVFVYLYCFYFATLLSDSKTCWFTLFGTKVAYEYYQITRQSCFRKHVYDFFYYFICNGAILLINVQFKFFKTIIGCIKKP